MDSVSQWSNTVNVWRQSRLWGSALVQLYVFIYSNNSQDTQVAAVNITHRLYCNISFLLYSQMLPSLLVLFCCSQFKACSYSSCSPQALSLVVLNVDVRFSESSHLSLRETWRGPPLPSIAHVCCIWRKTGVRRDEHLRGQSGKLRSFKLGSAGWERDPSETGGELELWAHYCGFSSLWLFLKEREPSPPRGGRGRLYENGFKWCYSRWFLCLERLCFSSRRGDKRHFLVSQMFLSPPVTLSTSQL